MAKDSKNRGGSRSIAISLNADQEDYIRDMTSGVALSSGASIMIEMVRAIEIESLVEIRGMFTHEEWLTMWKANQLNRLTPTEMCRKEALMARLIEPKIAPHLNEFKIDTSKLIDKLRKLSVGQTYAVCRRCSKFDNDNVMIIDIF